MTQESGSTTTVRCPQCDSEVPESAKFCRRCGEAIAAAPRRAPEEPSRDSRAQDRTEQRRLDGRAVASIVLGAAGFFLLAIPSIFGLLMGLRARRRALDDTSGRGVGLAWAGIAVSGLSVAVYVIALVVGGVIVATEYFDRQRAAAGLVEDRCDTEQGVTVAFARPSDWVRVVSGENEPADLGGCAWGDRANGDEVSVGIGIYLLDQEMSFFEDAPGARRVDTPAGRALAFVDTGEDDGESWVFPTYVFEHEGGSLVVYTGVREGDDRVSALSDLLDRTAQTVHIT